MNQFLLATTFASALAIGFLFGSPILLFGAYKQRLIKTDSGTSSPKQASELLTSTPEENLDSSPAPEALPGEETSTPPSEPACTDAPSTEDSKNCSGPGLRFCPNCGNCIKSSDKFCVHCGFRLEP
jgi:hypothetical protein